MMARPARVDMRWRNPWFLARLRLLGWKVRFTICSLGVRYRVDGGRWRRPRRDGRIGPFAPLTSVDFGGTLPRSAGGVGPSFPGVFEVPRRGVGQVATGVSIGCPQNVDRLVDFGHRVRETSW